MSQQSGGRPHVVLFKMVVNLCPHVPIIPLSRPVVDAPTSELHCRLCPEKPLSSLRLFLPDNGGFQCSLREGLVFQEGFAKPGDHLA
jgi:hypothetical protein